MELAVTFQPQGGGNAGALGLVKTEKGGLMICLIEELTGIISGVSDIDAGEAMATSFGLALLVTALRLVI